MNYEQKYKEALERAKSKIKNDKDHVLYEDDVIEIFPELAESEDERIRKSILEHIQLCSESIPNRDIWIAWLEKQGEQKSINDLTQQEAMDIADTKFKIRDWIVYNRNDHSRKIMQIYDIRDNRYYFNDNIHFSWSVKECDEKSHLWTIKDAKDGDVLRLGDVIAIFKKYIGQEECICYCSFCDNCYCSSCVNVGFEIPIENGEDNVYGCTNTTPATQEECDILFQKMREAGYKWNANKKKLIKL